MISRKIKGGKTLEYGICAAVGILLVFFAGRGYARGFLKTALSMASLIFAVAIVSLLQPYVRQGLNDFTPLYDLIYNEVCERMTENAEVLTGVTDEENPTEETNLSPENQEAWLTEGGIPRWIRQEVLSGADQTVSSVISQTGNAVADAALSGISFLLTLLAVFVLIHFLLFAFGVVDLIPVLRGVNRLLGGVLGFAQGLVVLWIACLILTVCLPSEVGSAVMEAVERNGFLSWLYQCFIQISLAVVM